MATRTGLELTSRVTNDGELQRAVTEGQAPAPGPDEVVVESKAAPISPSDLALLLGPVDISTLRSDGATTTTRIPEQRMAHLTARLDQAMKVMTVSAAAGAMFSQYRVLKLHEATVLPPGITAEQGASVFVNPMTVLCFLETMRREGHSALVLTAAASNLGQMLIMVCKQDGIGLVNNNHSADHVK